MMNFNFTVDRPKMIKRNEDAGEDAPAVSKDGILIVCDGTGSTGQAEHTIDGIKHTSAYLGSRQTAIAAERYLTEHYNDFINSMDDEEALEGFVEALGETIRRQLNAFVLENNLTMEIKGKSFRMLPTTFAAAVYKTYDDHIDVIAFSAGDSRVLLLNSEGLKQLSIDDVDDKYDAFSDVSNITNCISQSQEFRINYTVSCGLPGKGVLLATSDGFTDPIKPFVQEGYLIGWLGGCKSVLDPEASCIAEDIGKSLDEGRFTGKDDCSIGCVIFGYESDNEIRDSLRERFSYIKETFWRPFKDTEDSLKRAVDEYNGLNNLNRQLGNEVKAKIKAKLPECAEWILPSKAEQHSEAYDFLMSSVPFIQQEVTNIHDEDEKRLKEYETRLTALHAKYVNGVAELVRVCSFVAVDLGEDVGKILGGADISAKIIFAIQNYIAFEKERKRLCSEYNAKLGYFKGFSMISDNLEGVPPMDTLEEMTNGLLDVVSKITSVMSGINQSKQDVDEFFAQDSQAMVEIYNLVLNDGFKSIDTFIKSYNKKRAKTCLGGEYSYDSIVALRNELEHIGMEFQEEDKRKESLGTSDARRVERYKAVIAAHANELVTVIYGDSKMFMLFTGDQGNEHMKRINECEMAHNKAKELSDIKHSLWGKYKESYEYFRLDKKHFVNIPTSEEVE